MCIVHRIARNSIISYETSGTRTPSTGELQMLLSPMKIQKSAPVTSPQPAKKQTKRLLTIARGKPSAHCSAKEGFSFTLQSRDKQDLKDRSKYWNAKARKPKGKKPARVTIRGMYLN